MIHAVNISTLIFGIAGVAYFNLRAREIFAREDDRIQKYRLFETRDKLIHLVAEQNLREDGFVFEYFYRAIDFFIRHTDQVTFKSVVRALREAQDRGLDPAAEQELERVQRELKQECPEVREVVSDFYATMMQILRENSLVIRLLVNNAGAFRAVNEMRRVIGNWLFPTERQGYAFYKAYRNAARITAHAT
ncbi:hypothetical protein [Candidatus Binatus sp.]|jgi:hypothetical protein|uniref:hypothetical protein n=1 Tax=Candidatus Binatus sp. TaxID=2811406 RepID=UPI003CBB60E0